MATVLAAAGSAAALSERPRRTIRFALLGGEEQGLNGALEYARAHASEMNGCIAVLNTDSGGGYPRLERAGAEGRAAGVRSPRSYAAFGPRGGETLSLDLAFSSDQGAFSLAGLPALELIKDDAGYEEIHHKSGDTIDKVQPHALAAAAAYVGATAWTLAAGEQRLGPRLDRARILQWLKDANALEYVAAAGWWK